MTSIRQAMAEEAGILTEIAVRSEAYWGYDSSYMENFKLIYSVTEGFLRSNPTFVIEEKGNIAGFYGILLCNKETSLEYFYIKAENIGKGYGRILWNHMVDYCKNQGIPEIVLVTSPQAKGFYIKMGAIETGEVDSIVIKDRKIPRLVYEIQNK